MSDRSTIEWTQATWNPITGCTKLSPASPGCANCYASTFAERFRGTPGHYFERGFDVQLRPDKLDQPLRWRKPRRIFVNSMSDLFHDSVPDEYIAQVFAVMTLAPRHTFQVLTKRHARMRSLLDDDQFVRKVWNACDDIVAREYQPGFTDWPLPNVWLGVSAENQQWADIRIPALLDTPAAVRFVSAEPLLSGLDLSKWIGDGRRKGVPGPDCTATLRDRAGRDDLASSEMDGRRNSFPADLHASGAGRAEHLGTGRLSASHVQRRGCSPQGSRSPHRVDDSEQAPDPDGHGYQSHRWEQAEQSPVESGIGYTATEHSARPYVSGAEEAGSAWGEELHRRSDGSSGAGDPRNLGRPGFVTTGDCCEIRDHAVDRIGNRDPKELGTPSLSWVIVGGESGRGARPLHPDWVRGIRDQCQAAGVAFLFKQWGEYRPLALGDDGSGSYASVDRFTGYVNTDDVWGSHHGGRWEAMRRVGKKTAGRVLDGRTWDEYPAVAQS